MTPAEFQDTPWPTIVVLSEQLHRVKRERMEKA